jgi:bifunctional non-homologous end joining protein LigD
MRARNFQEKLSEIGRPEKIMFPGGFTKGQVADYYARAARWLLPHLKDRLVTLKRYPDGVAGEHFYEKDAPSFTPNWIETYPVPRAGGGPPINYILLNDAAALRWAADTCNLEIHPFLCRVPAVDIPTSVVFDLDPGEGAGSLQAAEAALLVKELLDRLKLRSFVKVSGSKGIHVHVPLNGGASYAAARPFARSIAETLEKAHPDRIVAAMAKNLRPGRVFVDWSQNANYKTTVAPYSLRARADGPAVAMPVGWDELKSAIGKGDAAAFRFEPEAALRRLERTGDLFAPLLKLKQTLPAPFLALAPAKVSRPARTAAPAARLMAALVPKPRSQGGRRLYAMHWRGGHRPRYELLLQIGANLKSWTLAQPPPLAPLAAQKLKSGADRALDEARFEGARTGEAEAVMVWDIGGYEIVEGDYHKGEMRVCINGAKLTGEWLLRRKSGRAWEWNRLGGATKPIPAHKARLSALSGQTMREIAAVAPRRANGKAKVGQKPRTLDLPASAQRPIRFIEPMYAEPARELPSAGEWRYEIKLDGYRCMALKHGGRVILFSRRGNDLAGDFPEIARQLAALPEGTMLDGEVVALDEQGRPSFNLLQNHRSRRDALRYYVFDLPVYQGRRLLGVPLDRRRAQLKTIMKTMPRVCLSEDFADGAKLIAIVRRMGLEGVVAKRADSVYEPGKRTGAWRKYKLQQGQEVVVGGYKIGEPLESLLVGVNDGGRLVFLDKVRYGLTPWLRRRLHERLAPLEQAACPFANLPERPTRKGAVTKDEMENCRWLKPETVAQVEFREWTPDGHLRHPAFVALRDDKDPSEVVRESA